MMRLIAAAAAAAAAVAAGLQIDVAPPLLSRRGRDPAADVSTADQPPRLAPSLATLASVELPDKYCTGAWGVERKKIVGAQADTDAAACAAEVARDAECGPQLYFGISVRGELQCRCVVAGRTCTPEAAPSGSSFAVYRLRDGARPQPAPSVAQAPPAEIGPQVPAAAPGLPQQVAAHLDAWGDEQAELEAERAAEEYFRQLQASPAANGARSVAQEAPAAQQTLPPPSGTLAAPAASAAAAAAPEEAPAAQQPSRSSPDAPAAAAAAAAAAGGTTVVPEQVSTAVPSSKQPVAVEDDLGGKVTVSTDDRQQPPAGHEEQMCSSMGTARKFITLPKDGWHDLGQSLTFGQCATSGKRSGFENVVWNSGNIFHGDCYGFVDEMPETSIRDCEEGYCWVYGPACAGGPAPAPQEQAQTPGPLLEAAPAQTPSLDVPAKQPEAGGGRLADLPAGLPAAQAQGDALDEGLAAAHAPPAVPSRAGVDGPTEAAASAAPRAAEAAVEEACVASGSAQKFARAPKDGWHTLGKVASYASCAKAAGAEGYSTIIWNSGAYESGSCFGCADAVPSVFMSGCGAAVCWHYGRACAAVGSREEEAERWGGVMRKLMNDKTLEDAKTKVQEVVEAERRAALEAERAIREAEERVRRAQEEAKEMVRAAAEARHQAEQTAQRNLKEARDAKDEAIKDAKAVVKEAVSSELKQEPADPAPAAEPSLAPPIDVEQSALPPARAPVEPANSAPAAEPSLAPPVDVEQSAPPLVRAPAEPAAYVPAYREATEEAMATQQASAPQAVSWLPPSSASAETAAQVPAHNEVAEDAIASPPAVDQASASPAEPPAAAPAEATSQIPLGDEAEKGATQDAEALRQAEQDSESEAEGQDSDEEAQRMFQRELDAAAAEMDPAKAEAEAEREASRAFEEALKETETVAKSKLASQAALGL